MMTNRVVKHIEKLEVAFESPESNGREGHAVGQVDAVLEDALFRAGETADYQSVIESD